MIFVTGFINLVDQKIQSVNSRLDVMEFLSLFLLDSNEFSSKSRLLWDYIYIYAFPVEAIGQAGFNSCF